MIIISVVQIEIPSRYEMKVNTQVHVRKARNKCGMVELKTETRY